MSWLVNIQNEFAAEHTAENHAAYYLIDALKHYIAATEYGADHEAAKALAAIIQREISIAGIDDRPAMYRNLAKDELDAIGALYLKLRALRAKDRA